ncbi:carbohydrate ABC transporter permease [Sediminispirochaeta smaragdinae]|jgi:arabinosaccharide transport system permease protein|uniref:Binding-protein-dependent transport systems inner membrane component n=1 Tax=Sediminispirochaeta smaragdinae (strain DSM 11293 / JCM 15392 / SEBR 4228) TaxID=573413 RepID=E1R619_SEDSS|nr:carbohydrate ABC transporter permease [Sediminispirochaeta smaragdinae]ADK80784.1 binding-protein-dependent transport systems inner membrane component [Sediminispirochaeta smaragdinae DSM 11293]
MINARAKKIRLTHNIFVAAVTLGFVVLAAIYLIPFLSIILSSFKPGREIIRQGMNLQFQPELLTLSNWHMLFSGTTQYFTWFFNSIGLTIVQVLSILIVCMFVAYGFAMYEFKFKNFFFFLVLLIMMIPFEILILPLYKQAILFRLINTWSGIIFPFIINASTIFFFKQYYEGLPKSLLDAGRVDGVTEYGIFFRIILPLAQPAFAAMSIANGMRSWNNFLWPLMVLRESRKFTLPIGLNTLLTPYGNNYDLLIVGSCFSIVPILLLYLAFQKNFISGMTAGSIKG